MMRYTMALALAMVGAMGLTAGLARAAADTRWEKLPAVD
jgi:hypothetical protein